jgi:hypothetical protein
VISSSNGAVIREVNNSNLSGVAIIAAALGVGARLSATKSAIVVSVRTEFKPIKAHTKSRKINAQQS